MATTMWAQYRAIKSVTSDTFNEASPAVSTDGVQISTTLITRDADTKEWTSVGLASEYHPTWIGWRAHKVGTEFTLSGDVTLKVRCSASVAAAGRVHAKLLKRTAGGSNVETLIAQADAGTDIAVTSATYTMVVTPSVPVTLAPGERLLYRIYVKRRSADFDTATFTLRYNSASLGITNFALTETVTFLPDTLILFPRRTAVAAIGNFFDLLPTSGVTTATTGVVNTVASGTEIPWTRTAGGTALEWISPRFKGPWVMASANQFGWTARSVTGHESNLAANCSVRVKAFRWRPDGTETLLVTTSHASEFTTTANLMVLPLATLAAEVIFAEDDRIVLRAYIIPIGTMGGSRTCTISYDHDSALPGYTAFSFSDMAEFKAEGDPAANNSVADGLPMSGIGN